MVEWTLMTRVAGPTSAGLVARATCECQQGQAVVHLMSRLRLDVRGHWLLTSRVARLGHAAG
jgi:hypothetical protein